MDKPRVLILVTDDDADWRGLLRDVLSMEGFEIEEAPDGVQGVEKAKQIRPNVILLDIDMPNMNGWDACKHIKADPATKDIPVIFVSTHAQREDKEKGLAVGATDYLPKPVDIEQLVPVLKKLTGSPT